MRGKRNMSQMKEWNENPEKELNKMGISKLLDTKFKTLVIGMLSNLSEIFNTEPENINMEIDNKKEQVKLKRTITKMNTVQGINSSR